MLTLANIVGWIVEHRRYFYWGLLALVIFAAIVFMGLGVRSCFHKAPHIDEKAINTINTANEKERKAELEKIVTENADVIKTVDGRNTITELTTEERSQAVADKVADANAKVEAAKAGGKDVTQEELIALIEGT